VLFDSFKVDTVNGKDRFVLSVKPDLAPYKALITPLSRKSDQQRIANELYKNLSQKWSLKYDESQSIGKRYRRADELGIPWSVTVDFDSIKDGKVTIRNRDSMKQNRISMDQIGLFLYDNLY
jgi:glycyl-tRNA synthetase